MQAVEAIHEQYGWIVDYEDPPYQSQFDLVDDTDPAWKKNHPDDHAVRVAGGFFQSHFPEPSTISSGDAKLQILQKLVDDYNASANPGKFAVRKSSCSSSSLASPTVSASPSVPIFSSSQSGKDLSLCSEASARYSIIGISRKDSAGRNHPVQPLLDIPINIPLQTRDATATFRLLADTISAASGVKVYLSTIGLSSDPLQDA